MGGEARREAMRGSKWLPGLAGLLQSTLSYHMSDDARVLLCDCSLTIHKLHRAYSTDFSYSGFSPSFNRGFAH